MEANECATDKQRKGYKSENKNSYQFNIRSMLRARYFSIKLPCREQQSQLDLKPCVTGWLYGQCHETPDASKLPVAWSLPYHQPTVTHISSISFTIQQSVPNPTTGVTKSICGSDTQEVVSNGRESDEGWRTAVHQALAPVFREIESHLPPVSQEIGMSQATSVYR